MTTATGRGWETVPAGTPSANSGLIALRKNNPSDNGMIGFPIASITANPSNILYWGQTSFYLRGVVSSGQPTITGLGNTSGMYVGMSVTTGAFPGTLSILSVDSPTQITLNANSSMSGTVTILFVTNRQGSDTDGNGSMTTPFATYEKARSRAIELGANPANPYNLQYLGGQAVNLGAFKLSAFVNIDFNGASFTLSSVVAEGEWESTPSRILMQNGLLASHWNLDMSALSSSVEKQILWRNIYCLAGVGSSLDLNLTGHGNEFFSMTNDSSTNAYAMTLRSFSVQDFNVALETNLAVTQGIYVEQTEGGSASLGLVRDVYSDVYVKDCYFSSRAATISGSVIIDGGNWDTDVISYKLPVLLNGGTVNKINSFDGLSTPPTVSAITTDKLIGLQMSSGQSKSFDISQILDLVDTDWRMSQVNHSSATPLLMLKNTVYNARLASGMTPCGFTLPLKASWDAGDWVIMTGLGSAGWTVARGDNDSIAYNGSNSPTSVSSANQFDCAFFYCTDPGQINVLWFTPKALPIAAAQSGGPGSPIAPGVSVNVSGNKTLDNFNAFTDGTGFTVPVGQVRDYLINFMQSISCSTVGNFYVYITIRINGSDYSPAIVECGEPITTGTTRTIAGCVTIPASALAEEDVISFSVQNQGDVDLDANGANWTIQGL